MAKRNFSQSKNILLLPCNLLLLRTVLQERRMLQNMNYQTNVDLLPEKYHSDVLLDSNSLHLNKKNQKNLGKEGKKKETCVCSEVKKALVDIMLY